jgi:hypothetical protein
MFGDSAPVLSICQCGKVTHRKKHKKFWLAVSTRDERASYASRLR